MMTRRFLKHKRLPMIAVSVTNSLQTDSSSLVRVNRYRTFQSPIDIALLVANFDECTESEYRSAFEKFPDRHNDSWEVDIVTGAERSMKERQPWSYF